MARTYRKEFQFKTYWYHRTPRYWFQKAIDRPDGVRDFPEVLRFEVESGHMPENKPPVRIFLGTESDQYRAERVFIWSIVKAKNPARVYEIYLMKDLKGYDRTGWKTSFTNYRYGIPEMAGGRGRAIYNDVDQIYLSDPAEMFDLDMNGAGMMCITQRETSVMLIDCAKMIDYWTLADAQGGKKHNHFRDIVHDNNLWGKLPGEWNARDEEYVAGKSKCFHFTTLQTQPWQPFPDALRYEPHPDGDVWFGLEREADRAGFTAFTRQAPSHRFGEIAAQYRLLASGKSNSDAWEFVRRRQLDLHRPRIHALVAETGSRSLLDYGAASSIDGTHPAGSDGDWPGLTVSGHHPFNRDSAVPARAAFDAVVSVDMLQHVPEEDIGWVLDEMFAAAGKFAYVGVSGVGVSGAPSTRAMSDHVVSPCTVQSAEWWKGQCDLASNRNPEVKWTLCVAEQDRTSKSGRTFQGGGTIASAA